MAPGYPLDLISLRAESNADDLAFVALVDAANALHDNAPEAEVRLIGGLMMSIHRLRWGLGPELSRETRDADFGAPLLAATIYEELELALARLGYDPIGQWRFEREVHDIPFEGTDDPPSLRATLDLVQVRPVPLTAEPTVDDGSDDLDLVAIVEALSRSPVVVDLEVTRRNGTNHAFTMQLADEASAVMLKAYAWRARRSTRDAHDVWRSMIIAHRAGCSPDDFLSPTGRVTADILEEAFGRPEGEANRVLAQQLGRSPDEAYTEIAALRQALGL